MVFGGVERDRVALNESTIWSGAAGGEHENPDALEHLNPIRQMADLTLTWKADPDAARDYLRLLDLDEAVARVEYTAHGARFKREYLASNPPQIMAVRITCDKPGLISFSAGLGNGELQGDKTARQGSISRSL
jgi:alpha-L-fucosidase 2